MYTYIYIYIYIYGARAQESCCGPCTIWSNRPRARSSRALSPLVPKGLWLVCLQSRCFRPGPVQHLMFKVTCLSK